MKAKSLFILFIIVGILFIYSTVCYRLLNNRVEVITRDTISMFFSEHFSDISSYEYLKAAGNEADSFRVFVKADNQTYYTFFFDYKNRMYKLVDVADSVPSYAL